MCVAFSPYVIYGYAFSHDDGLEDVRCLRREDIGTFCSVLNRELTERLASRVPRRSVYLAMGREDIDRFFLVDHRDDFLEFDDEILFVGMDDHRDASWFEAKYGDEDVTAALRVARRAIRRPRA